MLRDKVRCPVCKKEMKFYTNAEDTKQIFVLNKENDTDKQPIRVFARTCSTCGNVQLFGVI